MDLNDPSLAVLPEFPAPHPYPNHGALVAHVRNRVHLQLDRCASCWPIRFRLTYPCALSPNYLQGSHLTASL